MIKSNDLKDIPYPEDFTEDDKQEFDKLFSESKIIHPDIYENERWIIHYSIIIHIRAKKGMAQPFTDEELKKIVNNYKVNIKDIKCNGDEIDYLYDKENNPIFKDNSYFFKTNEEGNIANTSNIKEIVKIEL